jgi:hypothetical protein
MSCSHAFTQCAWEAAYHSIQATTRRAVLSHGSSLQRSLRHNGAAAHMACFAVCCALPLHQRMNT